MNAVEMNFSIITINYNNREGLQRTLDSVVSQTSSELEWIVIDGGSSDGSKEILQRNQNQIAYWCSEADKGIYHAMNKGVEHAHGKYCLFLNSGDVFCHSKVIEQLSKEVFFADIVSCDIYIDGYESSKLRRSVGSVNAYWIYDNTLYHQATWIRRDVLVAHPYHEEYRTISDWIFFFESFALYDCSYQHLPIAISVFYKDGMSCDPLYHDAAYTDKYNYLKKYYPSKYVDDKKEPQSYHYLSMNVCRMTKLARILIIGFFDIIAYLDIRLFKPLSRLFSSLG